MTLRTALLLDWRGGAGEYVAWPSSLSDYLRKELKAEFDFKYYVLDHTQFDANLAQRVGYTPPLLAGSESGATLLKALIRVDTLRAHRNLTDHGTEASGRSEDLSKRFSRFYKHNLSQKEDDHAALRALFTSELELNKHLDDVFAPTLKRLAKLGYPGFNNPRLEIKSGLNPATVLNQDARVHYVLGDGDRAVRLPDSYNGLGFKNLIYMVVEILDIQSKWAAETENRPPLHLIFIEEPEAHLHAQLQQVFIRNVLGLLMIEGDDGGVFKSQTVVTTHSPHIVYERGFKPIRYFRRHIGDDGEQTTQVLNLSAFYAAQPKDRDFLERYLKLTHCDLFFADAAILVEGNVERLLMPAMIESAAAELHTACLCILEVGGAFGHKFKSLIEFLGLVTLVVTDLDSVTPVEGAGDLDDDTEYEVPGAAAGDAPVAKLGKACLADTAGAVTSNQTLIQWLPARQTVADLFAATAEQRTQRGAGGGLATVHVCYQRPTPVVWKGTTTSLCGRTLEEAFGLENAEWCQHADRRILGLKLRTEPDTAQALAEGLHKRISGKGFDKTRFALGLLTMDAKIWQVPAYIRDGLQWLQHELDLDEDVAVPAVEAAE